MYKLTTEKWGNVIIRMSDNSFIPMDPANTDYQKYLTWLEKGNTPVPADPILAEDK